MFNEPKVLFWPVGTGDSTSIVVEDGVVMQVDIRDLQSAGDADEDHAAIVDILAENLPKVGGKPYLSAFALTHPDKDHVLGFADLLDRVMIGEIWFTPRVFKEHNADLCEDAVAFKSEAERRVQETIRKDGAVDAGDRVRLIGYDRLLEEDDFRGYPKSCFTSPGDLITEINGNDYSNQFSAFIHAPFYEEVDGDRNNTSLCMQVVLGDDPSQGGVLLFGDIAYPRLRKIIDQTKEAGNDDFLKWKAFLAPHHCSKSAMYQKADGEDVLKSDVLDDLGDFQVGQGIVVASCEKIPSRNQPGDNPPHAKAKARYQELANGGFLCTHEDGEAGEPIEFNLSDGELIPVGSNQILDDASGLKIAAAVDEARGSDTPPSEQVGYGA
ncbi:hypothetical protein [Thalassospira xiamenensis]|uniref:Metal-dependent hydrolase, beta-lactamase superfamily II n=1 Tax=Thalassospira xiamenensis TaxID=220697 RepID=A0A285U279_9PROT|nr:hypothetical protein [Thalassospira xiamenensis]SOC31082.1 Metal-dependent hydrolase, beta-lactamase superfamily II [Thalassospira xiamenensis]